jgi:hypothetical protein
LKNSKIKTSQLVFSCVLYLNNCKNTIFSSDSKHSLTFVKTTKQNL